MSWLINAIKSALNKDDTYYITIIIILACIVTYQIQSLDEADNEIAALKKSHIETKEVDPAEWPVRVLYKRIFVPGKERVVEKIVYKDLSEYKESDELENETKFHKFVFNRSNSFLLGLSNQNMNFRENESYMGWLGFSFRNKLDVLGGVSLSSKPDFGVQVIGRF